MKRVAWVLFLVPPALVACGGPRAVAVEPPGGVSPVSPSAPASPACEISGYELGPVRYLGDVEPFSYGPPGPTLHVADGRVVYSARATTASNSATDLDLFAVDADTGAEEQLTHDDGETMLVDVEGGDVLFIEAAAGASYRDPRRLVLRTGAGRRVDLGSYDGLPDGTGYGGAALYGGADAHQLEGGRAVWNDEQAIYLYDGAGTRALAAIRERPQAPPALFGETVVWDALVSGAGAPRRSAIFRHRGGEVRRISDVAEGHHAPVVAAEHVVWLCGERVCAWDAVRGARAIDDCVPQTEWFGCEHPVSDGVRAAWISGSSVKRYDPTTGQVQVAAAAAEVGRSLLRIAGDYLVWLEVPVGTDLYHGQGVLVFSDGAHRLEVAPVGLPCIVCGRYDPPLALSIAGDVIAWSYAWREDADGLPRVRPYAYARVVPEERCAR